MRDLVSWTSFLYGRCSLKRCLPLHRFNGPLRWAAFLILPKTAATLGSSKWLSAISVKEGSITFEESQNNIKGELLSATPMFLTFPRPQFFSSSNSLQPFLSATSLLWSWEQSSITMISLGLVFWFSIDSITASKVDSELKEGIRAETKGSAVLCFFSRRFKNNKS